MKLVTLPLCLTLLAAAPPVMADPPAPPAPPARPGTWPRIRPMPHRPLLPPPASAPAPAEPLVPLPPVPPSADVPAAPVGSATIVVAPVPRHPPRRLPRPRKPAGPPPNVKLTLEAPTLLGAWTVRVSNEGDVPVRLAADARLVSLDVTPRGESKPVHCELPGDMRPDDDLDRALVLPPKRAYAETFEPRLYCFGERALSALSPQAIVVARLGWPASSRAEDRQAVSAIDGIEPVVGSLPSLTSAPIALRDEPTPSAAPVVPAAATPSDLPVLRLSGATAVDATSNEDVAVSVTLRNDSSRPVRLRFKPETLAFDVTSARGVERCAWPAPVGAPMRELFSTLPPGGAETLSVMLAAYCGRKSFEHSGLMVVRPQLDTRRAGGQDIGLQTFNGQVLATTPTIVRLHRGTGSPRLARPHLEADAPSP